MITSQFQKQDLLQLKHRIANQVREARQLVRLQKQKQLTRLHQKKREQQQNLLKLKQKYLLNQNIPIQPPSVPQPPPKQPTPSLSQPSKLSFTQTPSPSRDPSISSSKRPSFKHHLQKVIKLHQKAKQFIQRDQTPTLPYSIKEQPSLNQKVVRSKSQEPVQLRMPIFVTESTYRKQQRFPPPVVNRTTRNGEVLVVHLVGDPSPAYDPLVQIETSIKKSELRKYSDGDSVQARIHSQAGPSEQSFQMYKVNKIVKKSVREGQEQDIRDLTPAPKPSAHRLGTPKTRQYSYCFRDIERMQNTPVRPKRKWVRDRMKCYAQEVVEKIFRPSVDQSKKVELELRHQNPFRTKRFERVKLNSII